MANQSVTFKGLDIDQWANRSVERMDAVFKESAQQLAEMVQTPIDKGGRMPVDTGYLRNSFAAAVNSYPSGRSVEGQDRFQMRPIITAIMQAKTGDRIIMGWSAEYAPYMEAKYAFLRLAVQQWPRITRDAAATVRRQYGA